MTPQEIYDKRQKLKMTQQQFAAWLGLKSYAHVLRMEKGLVSPSERLIILMQRKK